MLDFATESTFIKLYERSTICETNTSAILAIEDCEVYLIDFELIKTMMVKESEYMNYIFLLNTLELQQHRIALLLQSKASKRYLHFRELYKSIANRIRSTEITSYVGVTKNKT